MERGLSGMTRQREPGTRRSPSRIWLQSEVARRLNRRCLEQARQQMRASKPGPPKFFALVPYVVVFAEQEGSTGERIRL